jgi:hypothetical protein
MKPVVNGLEQFYGDDTEFLRLNAGYGEGQEVFLFYGMRGHPSYLLLAPDGEVLWRGIGPLTREALEQAVDANAPSL